jgi:hypothetical protein
MSSPESGKRRICVCETFSAVMQSSQFLLQPKHRHYISYEETCNHENALHALMQTRFVSFKKSPDFFDK